MQNWHSEPELEDEEPQVPKNIFMSDKTIQNLHSQGWFETDSRTADSADSRVLQINNTCFKMDEISDESDSQYEDFLLEVEIANNEFFKIKSSSNPFRQPASSSKASADDLGTSSKNSAFDYEAYVNGDYFDVDTMEDVHQNDYCLGDGEENGEEHGEASGDSDGVEDSDDEDNEDDEEHEDVDNQDDDKEDDDNEEMDPTAELPVVEVQKVSAGYIVNSNVYLTLPQWHTLIADDNINQTYCALCDEYIDIDTDAEHIEEAEHLDTFNIYKPLKRFELSITRLIRTKYHCGVCNVLFDDRDDNNHVDTKHHGDNMLFAINKASDLLDEYSLDRSRGAAPSAEDKRLDTMTYPLSDVAGSMSYSACFTKPPRVSAERPATPESTEEYEDYDPAESQQPGVSYAAMARKSKLDELPDVLKIELADKLVTVKFDSWHMIISTGLNQLYCMACLVSEHKRGKADHCRSSAHLERLLKCTVVKVYETHLIRKVDDKLYHCGHCNNLQPIDLMEEHVEQYHPRTGRATAVARNGVHQLLNTAHTKKAEDQQFCHTQPPNNGNQLAGHSGPVSQILSPIQPPSNGHQLPSHVNPIQPPNNGNQLAGHFRGPVNQILGPIQPPSNGNQLPIHLNPIQPPNNGTQLAGHSCGPVNQLFGPIQSPSNENQLPSHVNPIQPNHGMQISPVNQQPGLIQHSNHGKQLDSPVNQLFGPIQPPSHGNQLVGTGQAQHQENNQLLNVNTERNCDVNQGYDNGQLQYREKPGPSQIWNHENQLLTVDLPTTNLKALKESGLSNTMDLTGSQSNLSKSARNSPNAKSPINLAVAQNNETSNTSPAKSDPVECFKSIWQERSPAHSPKPERAKSEAKTGTNTMNSTEVRKESEEASNSKVEDKVLAAAGPSKVKKGSKNTPVMNFQPDFVKTIHQFGYKLSVHILSLNAIIKMQGFYRCVFCDVAVEEALLLEHMLDYQHVAMLPTAPYMPEFSLHLIRRINILIHCAICNLVLPNEQIVVLTHNASPTHSFLLKRALGFQTSAAGTPTSTNFVQPGNPATLPLLPLPPLIPLPPSRNTLPTLPPPHGTTPATNEPVKSIPMSPKGAKKPPKPAPAEEVLVDYTEEFYLVKQRKQLIKVRREALNTIVFCGDGTFYCFVCEANIGTGDSMEHIVDKSHRKRLTDCKMLNSYGSSLLRQLDNMYHCAICNVVIQKKFLQRHLDWYKHLKSTEETLCNTENDKLDENQASLPRIDIPTQKERLNVKDKGKFVLHFAFVVDKNHRKDSNDNIVDEDSPSETFVPKRMNKIVIVKDEVFKIKWEHWHGLVSYKDGYRCKICTSDLDEDCWREHVQEPKHVAGLGKPIIAELGRDLLRQLSDSKLHCLICNVELSTSDNICEHLDGKKHNKNRDLIIEESAKVNAYSDCENDVIFI